MKGMSGKNFCTVLERLGWVLARINGSHHIYIKAGQSVRLSVPVHGNKDLRVGLLNHLLKSADLKESDF